MRRCRRGHLQIEANRSPYRQSASGIQYYRCRLCLSARVRLKYRNDEAYREREKRRCLDIYYRRQASRSPQAQQALGGAQPV